MIILSQLLIVVVIKFKVKPVKDVQNTVYNNFTKLNFVERRLNFFSEVKHTYSMHT